MTESYAQRVGEMQFYGVSAARLAALQRSIGGGYSLFAGSTWDRLCPGPGAHPRGSGALTNLLSSSFYIAHNYLIVFCYFVTCPHAWRYSMWWWIIARSKATLSSTVRSRWSSEWCKRWVPGNSVSSTTSARCLRQTELPIDSETAFVPVRSTAASSTTCSQRTPGRPWSPYRSRIYITNDQHISIVCIM